MQIPSTSHVLPPAFSRSQATGEASGTTDPENSKDPDQRVNPTSATRQTGTTLQLSTEELAQLRQLKSRDREVRAHEQAHASVGGPYTGAPNYAYTKGPDGRQYASSGHVNIDSSAIAGNPEATLQKALQLKRAALAPAQPSQQDRRVAANAQQLAVEARADLNALLLETQPTDATARGTAIDTFI